MRRTADKFCSYAPPDQSRTGRGDLRPLSGTGDHFVSSSSTRPRFACSRSTRARSRPSTPCLRAWMVAKSHVQPILVAKQNVSLDLVQGINFVASPPLNAWFSSAHGALSGDCEANDLFLILKLPRVGCVWFLFSTGLV